ncbi:hypothetical protein MASR2M69_14090 [Bacteroidota bacterium]
MSGLNEEIIRNISASDDPSSLISEEYLILPDVSVCAPIDSGLVMKSVTKKVCSKRTAGANEILLIILFRKVAHMTVKVVKKQLPYLSIFARPDSEKVIRERAPKSNIVSAWDS